MHGVRAPQQLFVHFRQTEVAYLPGLDQCGHRADRLLDLRVLGWAVQVVEVDDIHAEAAQRVLARLAYIGRRAANAAVVDPLTIVDAELRGELHLVATATNG